jgi:hypothetical protein
MLHDADSHCGVKQRLMEPEHLYILEGFGYVGQLVHQSFSLLVLLEHGSVVPLQENFNELLVDSQVSHGVRMQAKGPTSALYDHIVRWCSNLVGMHSERQGSWSVRDAMVNEDCSK